MARRQAMEEPAAPSVYDSSWMAVGQALFAQPKFEKRESVSKGPDDHVFGGKSIAHGPCERFVVVFEMRTASRGVDKLSHFVCVGFAKALARLFLGHWRVRSLGLHDDSALQFDNDWPRLCLYSKLDSVETLSNLMSSPLELLK